MHRKSPGSGRVALVCLFLAVVASPAVAEPPILTAPATVAYGTAPMLSVVFGESGYWCDLRSDDGFYAYFPLLGGSVSMPGYPVFGATRYSGSCYDMQMHWYPLTPVTVAPASFPTPRLTGPATVAFGTAPVLVVDQLPAAMSCSVQGSDGSYSYLWSPGAVSAVLVPPPISSPWLDRVTYSGYCWDNAAHMFSFAPVDVVVTGRPEPTLTATMAPAPTLEPMATMPPAPTLEPMATMAPMFTMVPIATVPPMGTVPPTATMPPAPPGTPVPVAVVWLTLDETETGEGEEPASFTVHRGQDDGAPLLVYLAYSGSADAARDVLPLPSVAVLAAGELEKTFAVQPQSDGIVEGTETLIPEIVPSRFYTSSMPLAAEIHIRDNASDSIPLVSLSAGDSLPLLVEGSDLTIRAYRTGSTQSELTVPVNIDGTALPGLDFVPVPSALHFGVGQSEISFPLTTLLDGEGEGNEYGVLWLSSGSQYRLGAGALPFAIADAAGEIAPTPTIGIETTATPTPTPTSAVTPTETASPIQALDLGKTKSLPKLNFSRWEGAYTERENPPLDELPTVKAAFPDADPDAFHLRVTDAAANANPNAVEKIVVKLSTQGGPPGYNDDPTEIELVETGNNTGVFETARSLILVSDRFDDRMKIDDIEDDGAIADGKYDRSHLAFLGSTLKVVYNTKEAAFAVPADNVLTVKVIAKVLRQAEGDPPTLGYYFPRERAESALQIAKERYATCGIQLDVTLTDLDPKKEWGMNDLMAVRQLPRKGMFIADTPGTPPKLKPDKFTAHELVFLRDFFPDTTEKEIRLLFGPILRVADGPRAAYRFGIDGTAYTTDLTDDKRYQNLTIVSAFGVPIKTGTISPHYDGRGMVTAHEIGHLLGAKTNLPNHQTLGSRVMYTYGIDGERATVVWRKRFSILECEKFRASPLAR